MSKTNTRKRRVKIIFSLLAMWLAILGWDNLQTKTLIPNNIYYVNLILIATLLVLWNVRR